MIEIVAPRLASTVLLLRDGSSSDIEVFMMVRHHQIEFNSGALVFPGGSVDKNDKEIAANPALYSGGDGLDGDALAGAKGNIGVNVASGTGNLQANSLALAVAQPSTGGGGGGNGE
mgnify:CR=1 FL=1